MSLQSATSTHFCCFQSTPPILQELLIVDFLLWPAVHDFVAWFYWMPRNLQTDDSGWFRSHDIWSPAITTAFLISLLMFRRTLHVQENQEMSSMSPMKLHSLVSFCLLVPAHNDGLRSLNPTTKAFNKHEVATQRFTANLPLIPDLLSIHPLGSFTLKTIDIHLCTIGNFTFWHLLYQS